MLRDFYKKKFLRIESRKLLSSNLVMKICDQVPLNEALWGEYQIWENYLIAINTYNFLHIVMQKLLLSDIPIKSYKMLNFVMYDIIPNNFTEIWALKD